MSAENYLGVKYPSLEEILEVMEEKNYRIFSNEAKGFNLNLVGVRTPEIEANEFDDFICVFYRSNDNWVFVAFRATTDPGAYWLKNPMNKMGTAIVKEGQYKSLWKKGKHLGKYDALVQNKPITVYRDADRDEYLDTENSEEETGLFGINLHRASEHRESDDVNKWSAGCQVVACPLQFNYLMQLVDKSAERYGDSFTYTLINFSDFY